MPMSEYEQVLTSKLDLHISTCPRCGGPTHRMGICTPCGNALNVHAYHKFAWRNFCHTISTQRISYGY